MYQAVCAGEAVGDPLVFLERVMEISGVVSVEADRRPWWYRPVSFLVHIIYVNCYLCTILFILEDHPFFDKMESFQCFLSIIHMSAKFINLHYNTRPYRRLVATARRLWEEARLREDNHPLMASIYTETNNSVKYLLLMFAGAVPTSAVMTGLYNMQVEPERRETLYMVWDPVPDDSWYWTSCLYEGSLMALSLMLLAISLACCYTHCLQAAGQMRLLRHMLEAESVDVNACVLLHMKIIAYVKEIQNYFAGQMFLEVVLSSLQNSMRCYMVMRLASAGDPKAVGAFFILLLCMSGPFIVCLSGHVVTVGSEKVMASAYQNAWYSLSNRERRTLAVLTTMATKTIRLHYRGLLDFSMERYSVVMQATYSYITLLKGADVA